MRSLFVQFRGEEREVTIGHIASDPETNSNELDWCFTDGVEPDPKITDLEEQAIINKCWDAWEESFDE